MTADQPKKPRSFAPPVAVDRAYDLWLWLDGRVTDFSASAKAQLGRRILDMVRRSAA